MPSTHRPTCAGPPTCLGIPCLVPPPVTPPTSSTPDPTPVGVVQRVVLPDPLPSWMLDYWAANPPHTQSDDYAGWDQ